MFEFGIAVVDVIYNEEEVAIYFWSFVGVEGMEVIGKEFWDDPVWVWLVLGNEGANELGIILKVSFGEMA